VFPTGTKPNDEYLFNAVQGTHNFQIASRWNAGYQFWQDCDCNKKFSIYADALVSYLFKAKQHRLLGLKDRGAGSSYLGIRNELSPLIRFFLNENQLNVSNLLNCELKVGADWMIDAALMFQSDCGNWSSALGYNIWWRSKEEAKKVKCCFDENTYYIVQNATINSGDFVMEPLSGFVPLSKSDVDACPALSPAALSHKIFGFIGYNWKECDWQPFLDLFVEYEFSPDNRAVNQWGLGIKGGLAF
jgi:hypothetical protein